MRVDYINNSKSSLCSFEDLIIQCKCSRVWTDSTSGWSNIAIVTVAIIVYKNFMRLSYAFLLQIDTGSGLFVQIHFQVATEYEGSPKPYIVSCQDGLTQQHPLIPIRATSAANQCREPVENIVHSSIYKTSSKTTEVHISSAKLFCSSISLILVMGFCNVYLWRHVKPLHQVVYTDVKCTRREIHKKTIINIFVIIVLGLPTKSQILSLYIIK